MKLISMHVDNFGGLHDYDYNFEEGLNIILHDNGWGKTTMAAFLKAMLYGFDSKRSKDITENERKRYYPWQGGQYGGSLDFEAEGVHYRIYRSFGETPRFDKVRIINAGTKTTARIDPGKIGEELFHLDANAFQRSVFIDQNGLSLDGAASSIHTRLNTLVSQANDVAAFDAAIASLTAQIKIYEKTGGRGQIAEVTRQIAVLEQQRDRLEEDIAAQDAARDRISQIDVLLASISEDLELKKKKLDEISGQTKRREASNALIKDIDTQIVQLQAQCDAIRADLGGKIPTPAEIDAVKRHSQAVAGLTAQLHELEMNYAKLKAMYLSIQEKFRGTLPTKGQLDELQGIYGKLQGVLSTNEESTVTDGSPQGYDAIEAAVTADGDYIKKLKAIVDGQSSLLQLIRKLEILERDITQEMDAWTEKQQRYAGFASDVNTCREKVESQKQYAPEVVGKVISGLDELQKKTAQIAARKTQLNAAAVRESASWSDKKKRFSLLKEETVVAGSKVSAVACYSTDTVAPVIRQLEDIQKALQNIAVKQEALDAFALTREEQALLEKNQGPVPDEDEGPKLLKHYRSIAAHQAEVQVLYARVEGEQDRAYSLQASMDQLRSAAPGQLQPVAEPKRPAGGAMIGAGVAVAVIAAVLGILVMPALAALVAVGVMLVILGMASNSRYKANLRTYEAFRASAAKRQESAQKEAQLQAQLTAVQANIVQLRAAIADREAHIAAGRQVISAWMRQWAGGAEASEALISQMIGHWEEIRKARKKWQYTAEARDYIEAQTAQVSAKREAVDARCPAIAGKSVEEALQLLRKGETEYRIEANKLATAKRDLEKFMADAKISEDMLAGEAPGLGQIHQHLQHLETELADIEAARISFDDQYPEIACLSYDAAMTFLREKLSGYQVTYGQLQTILRSAHKFMTDAKVTREQLANEKPENVAQMEKERDAAKTALEQMLEKADPVLGMIGMRLTAENAQEQLRKAYQLLSGYQQHTQKLADRKERQDKKHQQITQLQEKLDQKLSVLQGCYGDAPVPERLALVREELIDAEKLREKIASAEAECNKLEAGRNRAAGAVDTFLEVYGHFDAASDDALSEICAKARSHTELLASIQQLEKQRASIRETQQTEAHHSTDEENELRTWIANAEARRDKLLVEYTQKSDLIRQADQSLEKYPDVSTQIRQLYEQKQKDQNVLVMLKRTIRLITQAKENLADRYLSKVEHLFNNYMHIWLNNDAVRGILDIDFNVSIEENGKVHVAEGYSTGYCDLIDFCMRLALVDTLFENEQPFLILDDPFVNLDPLRLDKALELLSVMAANKQIVYFVCHPIRAADVGQSSTSREAFVRLAEATRKTVEGHRSDRKEPRKIARRSPKEMYRVVENGNLAAIRPAKPDYTITNNIFSMNFLVDEARASKDHSYELFFIDDKGRVLNDRQLVEIKGGKLSVQRVQFCLNSRDDSGDRYELLIRESGQDDHELVARIPFRAKLSFTGSDSFDF